MPLDDREQKILAEIERQFYEEDPELARAVDRIPEEVLAADTKWRALAPTARAADERLVPESSDSFSDEKILFRSSQGAAPSAEVLQGSQSMFCLGFSKVVPENKNKVERET